MLKDKNYKIPSDFIGLCGNLHNYYAMKKILYNTEKINPKITYTDCINFVNSLEPPFLLSKVKRLYYE